MTPNALDAILLAILAIVVVKTTLSGFIAEFFSKAAVIVGAAGAVLLYRRLVPVFVSLAGDVVFPEIIAFLSIFLVLYIAVKLVQNFAGNVFQGDSLANLDRALGFFLGLVEGMIIVAVILIAMRAQPWLDFSRVTEDSVFVRLLGPFLSAPRDLLHGIIPVKQ